ncbi:MAG: hypothetical protein IJ168_06850 [Eubacterium sp.]|nr:hypothetical protein [Eubacterium sp.]
MTDTREYRQYTSYSQASNLISSFDFDRSAAAKARPLRRPEPEQGPRLREGEGIKSRQQLQKEERLSRAGIIRIAVAAVLCLALIGAVLNSFALKNQLTRENSKMETEIANAESEYISLESKLNSLVSISMIDKYAVEQLGMTKVHSNQIQYMDVAEYKDARAAALAEAEAQAEAEAAEAEATAENADAAAAAAEDNTESPAEGEVINE